MVSKTAMENQQTILETLFLHSVIMKMYHFQTKLYGAHKTVDSYLSTFMGSFDNFMEVSQGTFNTVTANSFNLNIKTVNDRTVDQYLVEYLTFLDSFDTMLGKGHTDLLNIRDEMKAGANQLRYLLRFK